MQILHECCDSRDDHFADCQNRNRICSRRAPGEFTGSRNADDDFGGKDDEDVLILEHLQSIDSSTSTSREVSDDNIQKCLRFAEESGLYDAGDDMRQNLDSDITEQLVDSTQSTNLEEIWRQTYDNC